LCEAGCDHSKETGTSCTYNDSPPETCKYTATFDPHAGPVGYFKFDECGDVANPVIKMKQGTTYIFDQSHDSNWYHPLGWAYYVDGAHNEVDELEPGINPPDGGACYLGSGNIQCNKNKAECTALGSEYWYEPGALSSYSGCCLCQASCDHTKETVADPSTCSYYDSPTCAADNTCQAPMYYKDGVFAGAAGYDNTLATPTGGEDFGLDAYEPEFFIRKEDWLATKYTVKLTLTDTTYATDIFYFCHIHGGMSGYIKIADASGTVVSTTGTGNALIAADYHKTPSTYESLCGGYNLDAYKSAGACTDTFLCTTATLAEGSFGDCLNAMDCSMDLGMKTELHSNDIVSFMWQMIPHHENAINMAKLLMKKDTTLAADGEVMDMLWDIINVQGMQIQAMQGWLSEGKYALSSSCPALASGAGHVAPTLLAAGLAAAALLAA
jgi:hypothetical protein